MVVQARIVKLPDVAVHLWPVQKKLSGLFKYLLIPNECLIELFIIANLRAPSIPAG